MFIEKFLATSAAFLAAPFADATNNSSAQRNERDLTFTHTKPRENNRARHRRNIEYAIRAASGSSPHHPSRMR